MNQLMKKSLALLLAAMMMLSLTFGAVAEAPAYTDGTTTASAYGMNGDVPVTVTVEGGKITAITVGENSETAGIGDQAINTLPQAMIDAQSPAVDTVSGATVTSNALIKAVSIALGLEEAEAAAVSDVTSADVIVVGAGLAGLVTANRAAELGANVILMEQSGAVGGSSRLAGGYVSGARTVLQEAVGLEDSYELAFQDLGRIGGWEAINQELAWTHVQRAGELVNWIVEKLGVELGEPGFGAYTPTNVARVYQTTGGVVYAEALNNMLQSYIESGKVTLMLNTKVDELVVENDVVTGVVAGGTTYSAPSVVLATGGYGYNEEWVARYNFAHSRTSAPATAIGTGYDLAESVGASFTNMEYLPAYAGAVDTSEDTYSLTLSANCNGWSGSIWVDLNGKRMTDEVGFTTISRQEAWENSPENYVFIVLTEEMKQTAETPLLNVDASAGNWDRFEAELAEGYCVFSGSTIEELAANAGIDAEGLKATVEAYNQGVANGKDEEFGRTEQLMAIESETYYAVRTVPYILLTKGGVDVSTSAQVLREDGSAVEGLYACGEIIGGANLGGYGSHGGLAHATCFVWGTICAESAVSRATGTEVHVEGYTPVSAEIPAIAQ